MIELCQHDKKYLELLEWSWFQTKYASSLRDGTSDGHAPQVFSCTGEVGEQQWEEFHKRVIEHVSEPLLHWERDTILTNNGGHLMG